MDAHLLEQGEIEYVSVPTSEGVHPIVTRNSLTSSRKGCIALVFLSAALSVAVIALAVEKYHCSVISSTHFPYFVFSETQSLPSPISYELVDLPKGTLHSLGELIVEGSVRNFNSNASNGLSVALLYKGQVFYQGSFGNITVGKSKGVPNENTVYQIGSISKIFTSTMLYMLVEQGKVSLDDPLSKYLPELSIHNPWKDAGYEITLDNLASMTSGIPRETPCSAVCPGHQVDCLYSECTAEQIYQLLPLLKYSLLFPPGSSIHYSNFGVAVLAHALQNATGIPFRQWIHDNILVPLNMTSTGFNGTEPAIMERLAWKEYISLGYSDPDGGMYSTLSDMIKFMQFISDVNASATGSMLSGYRRRRMHLPAFVNPNGLSGFSHGTFALTLIDNHWAVAKGGDIGVFGAQITMYPRFGLSVIALGSYGASAQSVSFVALSALIKEMDSLLADNQPDHSTPPGGLSAYAGVYGNQTTGNEFTITANEQDRVLESSMLGIPFQLVYESTLVNGSDTLVQFRMELIGPYLTSPGCHLNATVNVCPVSCLLRELAGDGEVAFFRIPSGGTGVESFSIFGIGIFTMQRVV